MIQTEDSLDILESPSQAEGESGLETVGFTTFGGQRINDSQKKQTRPCSLSFGWNFSGNAAQLVRPLPAPYWGTFITAFDGTILAGARLDGAGSASVGWGPIFPLAGSRYSDGIGGNTGIASLAFKVQGLSGSLCGFDIFINTLQTIVNCGLSYWNPYTAALGYIDLVLAKVPQLGEFTMAGAPAGTPPFLIVRRRPEGYNPNEDGAQIFCALPYATAIPPAGFIFPATVGVPSTVLKTYLGTTIVL